MATAKKTNKTSKASKTNKASETKKAETGAVRKNNKKGLIIGICGVVAFVVIVVLAVVIATTSGPSESYFKSDGAKYVLTINKEDIYTNGDEEAEYTPEKTHIVYEYKDDTITGVKIYYQYADSETATKAMDYIKENQGSDSYKEIATNGRYVVLTMDETAFADTKASDVKAQIDAYEELKNSTVDDSSSEETTTTETVEETTETTTEETNN